MKFILGVLTGVSLALIYHGDFHDSLLQEATSKWSEWQTIAARHSEQPASVSNESAAPTNSRESSIEVQVIEPVHAGTAPTVPESELTTLVSEDAIVETESNSVPESEPVFSTTPAAAGYQVAWMPFHSETSASGFAEKLSMQLQRDLSIRKVSPGHYEVGFEYTSPLEQQVTLDQIENITGYRAAAGS